RSLRIGHPKQQNEFKMSYPNTQSEFLRRVMERRGLKQADIVRGAGLTRSCISQALSGIQPLGRATRRRVANFLGVSERSLVPMGLPAAPRRRRQWVSASGLVMDRFGDFRAAAPAQPALMKQRENPVLRCGADH